MIHLILGIIVGLFLLFDSHPDKMFLIIVGISFILKCIRIYQLEKNNENI